MLKIVFKNVGFWKVCKSRKHVQIWKKYKWMKKIENVTDKYWRVFCQVKQEREAGPSLIIIFDLITKINRHYRAWQTRTHCCGHIVAHDVLLGKLTGKHKLGTQNVSGINQKHFFGVSGDTNFASSTDVARASKLGKICVDNYVSSFATAFTRFERQPFIRAYAFPKV